MAGRTKHTYVETLKDLKAGCLIISNEDSDLDTNEPCWVWNGPVTDAGIPRIRIWREGEFSSRLVTLSFFLHDLYKTGITGNRTTTHPYRPVVCKRSNCCNPSHLKVLSICDSIDMGFRPTSRKHNAVLTAQGRRKQRSEAIDKKAEADTVQPYTETLNELHSMLFGVCSPNVQNTPTEEPLHEND